MLHARFQDHRFWRRRFLTIYGCGGHLGHVTWTIIIKVLSPFPRRLHMKFGYDWPNCFREENLLYMYIAPGVNYFSLTHLFSQFSPLLQVFPIK